MEQRINSSFRVNEEKGLFEKKSFWLTLFLLNVFTALIGARFYILFAEVKSTEYRQIALAG